MASTFSPVDFSLLCLPCAGSSATMYLRWRQLMPAQVRIVPVELPGRGIRGAEPFAEDFDVLVAGLCAEQRAAMQGPFALFGHSMGALLAYGMANVLQTQKGAGPRAVFVSGCPAPSCTDPSRFADKQDDAALTADLRRQGGTPEEVFGSAEFMRLTLDALAADYRVCASFRPAVRRPLRLPLHAFGGRGDDIGVERIEAWSRETQGPFTLDWFDGGHFFIRQQEQAFIAMLLRRLHQVAAPCGQMPSRDSLTLTA